jgi:hypothetical protein
MASVTERWEPLGGHGATDLVAAREELHCAAQVAASVPRVLAEPQPDWSHSALQWDDAHRAMLSNAIPGATPFRVALRPADLHVLLLPSASGDAIAEVAVGGLTVEDLFTWLTERSMELTGQALPKPLEEAEEGLPEPCTAGHRFNADDGSALAELDRYYGDAAGALSAVVGARAGAAPLRIWPHHLDIATLITLDPGKDAEEARSVGVGMQPGDGGYAEPYFYVTPWPYPPAEGLPELAGGGRWHTEGWMGALLLGSDLVAADGAPAQAVQLDAFLNSAVGTALGLLGA